MSWNVRRSAVTVVIVAGACLTAPAKAQAADDDEAPRGGLTAAQLAVAIEQINVQRLVNVTASRATASRATSPFDAIKDLKGLVGRPVEDPDTQNSLEQEASKVDAKAQRLQAGGGIDIVAVDVTVHDEKVEKGVRFITLDVRRTMDDEDGLVWEELVPYAVIDQDGDGLKAGQVFAVDREAVEEGHVPDQLRDFSSVTVIDDSQLAAEIDPNAPAAPDPGIEGSENGVSSSPERPDGPSGPDTPEAGATERGTKASASTQAVAVAGLSATQRERIRDYALRYAKSRNTNYYAWDNDCTNFISQAMAAGGWGFDYGFYQGDGNWWYTGAWPIKASWTWAGAENWYKFAVNAAKRTTIWPSVYNLRDGDILQYKPTGAGRVMLHSMVTTGHTRNGTPTLSYHTDDTLNKPFTDIPQGGKIWFAHKV